MKNLNKYITLAFFVLSIPSALSAGEPADTLETLSTRGLVIKGESLENRLFGDVRNMMTGVMPGVEVTENAGGWWNVGSYNTFHASTNNTAIKYRGSGEMTFMLDGIVLPYSAYAIDLSQIESITVVGDLVDKAKYGPMASYSMLNIKTKTGGYNQPLRVKVSAETGIAMTGIVPEYADGVEYAILNNQARANSGYTQLYSPIAIQNFLRGDAYDLKYPNVDYRSLMMANMMPVSNVAVNVTGGGAKVKYAFTLAETYTGDILKTDQHQDYNKINISASVTSRITDFMTVNAGFNSLLAFRRSARGVAWNSWQNVPGVAYPVILGVNKSDEVGDELEGLTIYGTNSQWQNNYYALLAEGGFSTRRTRSGMIYSSVNLDFSRWIPGLKSRTYLGYSTFIDNTISKSDDYLSYYWDPTAENGLGVLSPTHQGVKAASKGMSTNGTTQLLQFNEDLTWEWRKNGHNVDLGASFLMYNAAVQGATDNRRLMQLIGSAKYNYKNRYIVEGVVQYAGSSRFDKDSRFKPFASLGASWVASNEDFLKDVSWIDYLRIRGEYGTIGQYSSAFGDQYLYESRYSRANGYTYGPDLTLTTWFGANTWISQKTGISRLANPDLSWETMNSWLVGLDFDFCDGFSLSLTAYSDHYLGEIAEITTSVPGIYGIGATSLYANYTSKKVMGYEASLNYRRQFGDFTVMAGASVYNWDNIRTRLVTDDYLYDYQKLTGTSTFDIRGLECIGKYETQEQIETIPSYAEVRIGDLMYKDQNEDGKIDNNDRIVVGSSRPKLRYSVNLGFRYKNFEVLAVGTGRAGQTVQCTGGYFWSGWGDGNYSAFVRDNIGGDYPNLTYVKSENNFVASSFWLKDGSWFKIQDVSVSYDVPMKNKKVVKGLKFSLKGQNLATITPFKYLDPEATASGLSEYPLFRTFTVGARIIF